jgi:hypothetical protein
MHGASTKLKSLINCDCKVLVATPERREEQSRGDVVSGRDGRAHEQ